MESIRRGTTPAISFSCPFSAAEIDTAYVTFEQNGIDILEKDKESLVISDNAITLYLTQEETLKFVAGTAKVQVRVKLVGSQATATQIFPFVVNQILKEGVI